MSNRPKSLLAFAGLFALLALVLFVVHLRYRLIVQACRSDLKAKGEKLTIEEVRPKPLSAENNGAALFLQAVQQMPPDGPVLKENPPRAMRMVSHGRAMIGWSQPDLRAEVKKNNSWVEAATELEVIAPALQEIRAALERPGLDFNLNYQQGFSMPLPHLPQLKRASQKFCAAVLYDLREKRLDAALTNILALMALAKAPHDDRLIISELVRLSVAHTAMAVTWEALQAPGWTDPQLERLQEAWQEMQFIRAMESCFLMERAVAEEDIQRFRKSSRQLQQFVGNMARSFGVAPPGMGKPVNSWQDLVENSLRFIHNTASHAMWRWYWSYEDETRLLQITQLMIDSARMAGTTPSYCRIRDRLNAQLNALGLSEPDEKDDPYGLSFQNDGLRFLFSRVTLASANALRRAIIGETARELTVAAIALKRYQLQHGHWPHRLATLSREFLEEPPRDYMDGKPLRYRLNADGSFILYSVGDNGKDDDGDPTRVPIDSKEWWNGRDWVWPQPASAEEVAAFKAKLVK